MLSDFPAERQAFIIQEIFKLKKFKYKSVLLPCLKNETLIKRLRELPCELIGITDEYKGEKDPDPVFKYHFRQFLELIPADVSLYEIFILDTNTDDLQLSIKYAFEIAPINALIICPCYPDTINTATDPLSEHIDSLVQTFGHYEYRLFPGQNLDKEADMFGFVVIAKESTSYQEEFKGFFLDDMEEDEPQENSMIKYSAVRDMVRRYVNAIKLYDTQLSLGVELKELLQPIHDNKIGFQVEPGEQRTKRREFKIALQKASWTNIFNILNLDRFSTRQLRQDIEKFIEEQTALPFTMRNILHMLQLVVGTVSERMDRAIIEAFDSLTLHHHENRLAIPGWKSNSHYMVGKKFIISDVCPQRDFYKKTEVIHLEMYNPMVERVNDISKALCLLTNQRYEKYGDMYMWFLQPYKVVTDLQTHYFDCKNSAEAKVETLYAEGIRGTLVHCVPVYGQFFDFAFWRIRGFKKGSMHFEFKDEKIWRLFNKRVAEIKGYELHEFKKETAYQKRNTGKSDPLF